MKWPRITLVTATLDQGRYLETAIQSVLAQRYPNLEYFVLDGGSRDESGEILARYRHRLTRVEMGPDGGQAAALQKGLEWGTGEIFQWLNADDLLEPGALRRVAKAFVPGVDAVAAGWIRFSARGTGGPEFSAGLSARGLVRGGPRVRFHQPGLWLRREAALACGGIDPAYYYAFDWDLALRYLNRFPRVRYLRAPLIRFRHHAESKTATVGQRFSEERLRILRKLAASPDHPSLHALCRDRLALELWWRELNGVMTDAELSGARKAWAILRAVARNPSTRLSRMTAGALRRAIAGA